MATSESVVVVAFRPRPPHPKFGTRWMPAGGALPYGPFHALQGPIPPDATQTFPVHCSPSLSAHLHEFYTEIRPLLAIPSLDSNTSFRDHWTTVFQGIFRAREAPIGDFEARAKAAFIAIYYPAISSSPQTHQQDVLDHIMRAEFGDMDNRAIEQKMWMCILHEIAAYRGDLHEYYRALSRRSGPWDRILAASSLAVLDVKNYFSGSQIHLCI
ncbi:hypothetical protein FB451DRAFT_1490874 [Mycena latifolia]|nr:hypothetical protein FB451DRAFT_1490874 [Mycena latifolia]